VGTLEEDIQMAGERFLIEGWPMLLPAGMAARYLSLDTASFQSFATRQGIRPVEPVPGEVRWMRSDLDKHVKRLPPIQAPNLGCDRNAIVLDEATITRVAAAIAAQLNEKPANEPQRGSEFSI
jgi:hypothetical protein